MCESQIINYPKTYLKYLKLYSNDVKKDIKFIFDDSNTEIRAHKLILETVSPVFETMFNGSFAEKDTAIIRHIEPQIFQKLIDVIYMQKVAVSSLEEAVELCNAAEMYDIEDLKDIASDFICENCSFTNCFYLLEKAFLFNLTNVTEKCRELMRVNFVDDLKFLELPIPECEINENVFIEFLTVNESPDSALYQLLEYFVTSGKFKSYQRALGKIRFLTMSIEEIVLVQFLTESEKLAIISNIEANNKGTDPIVPMPEHLSTDNNIRQEITLNSFSYKYFWITRLIRCPVTLFVNQFKRVSAIPNLFTIDQIEHLKKVFENKLNGEDLKGSDFQVVKKCLSQSNILRWYDIIHHGKNQVTIFGRELCGIKTVALDFIL